MTATRWWVRLFAKWKAWISGVQPDISLFFAAVRTVSLAAGIMGFFGVPWWFIGVLMALMFAGLLVYAWLYNAGGVRNQVGRDNRDYSNNFAGPNGRIVQEIGAKMWVAGQKGRELTEDERRAIEAEGDKAFQKLRDGVALDFDDE